MNKQIKMRKVKRELEPHEKVIRVIMIGVCIIFGFLILTGIAIEPLR